MHPVPWRWPSSQCCGRVGAQPCSWSSEQASITSGSWRGWPFLLPPTGLVPQQTQVFLHVFLPSFLPLSSLYHLWLQVGCCFPALASLLAQVNLQWQSQMAAAARGSWKRLPRKATREVVKVHRELSCVCFILAFVLEIDEIFHTAVSG